MAKKLIPSQIRTLAVEATNKVFEKVADHNREITESEAYINFERDISTEPIGKLFDEIVHLAKSADDYMKAATQGTQFSYSSNTEFTYSVTQTAKTCRERLKIVRFPLADADQLVPGDSQFPAKWGAFQKPSVFDYIHHKLLVNQLTDDLDIRQMIDDIVHELVSKL